MPVIDFEYYIPNFKKFDYKNKLFERKDENLNQNEIIYSIDLKIFNPIEDNVLPEINDQNYF